MKIKIKRIACVGASRCSACQVAAISRSQAIASAVTGSGQPTHHTFLLCEIEDSQKCVDVGYVAVEVSDHAAEPTDGRRVSLAMFSNHVHDMFGLIEIGSRAFGITRKPR